MTVPLVIFRKFWKELLAEVLIYQFVSISRYKYWFKADWNRLKEVRFLHNLAVLRNRTKSLDVWQLDIKTY